MDAVPDAPAAGTGPAARRGGIIPGGDAMSGKKVVAGAAVVALAGGLAGIVLAHRMYSMIRTPPPPLPSPDRSMVLVQSITDSRGEPRTHMRVAFEIRDARTGDVLFSRQTRASALRKWELNWIGNDRVTMLSWEIGRLEWRRGDDGSWRDAPDNGDRVWPPVGAATSAGGNVPAVP